MQHAPCLEELSGCSPCGGSFSRLQGLLDNVISGSHPVQRFVATVFYSAVWIPLSTASTVVLQGRPTGDVVSWTMQSYRPFWRESHVATFKWLNVVSPRCVQASMSPAGISFGNTEVKTQRSSRYTSINSSRTRHRRWYS